MDSSNVLKFLPLGGIGDVTKNLYVYEYRDEILLVDCGLGFPDESMVGVELLIPDVDYLQKTKKRIVGMAISHGHEDHLGALPFILPTLPKFPVYATPLTAAFSNEKLKEFSLPNRVESVNFDAPEIKLGSFSISFIRVTHSVPDTSHIFIKTPVGNFYHGSDFKFDLTPFDNKKSDFAKIARLSSQGVVALMSDCLRAEKHGSTPSEQSLTENFEREMKDTKGKFIVTTYSSNISRLNQAIEVSEQLGRRVCFVGRSLIKAKDIAQDIGYMKLRKGLEVSVEQLKNFKDDQLTLFIAGSQGQENSSLTRVANDEFREIKIRPEDVVVFSSDSIPGNEKSINNLIDTLSKKGARVVYSEISDDFHVSGHGASDELMLLMELVKPQMVVPISGNYKHMVAYKKLAKKQGFSDDKIILTENGQETLFTKTSASLGQKYPIRNVFLDQITGEEVDHYVLRDRQKIAKEGLMVVICEIDSMDGQLVDGLNVIGRGFSPQEIADLNKRLTSELTAALSKRTGKVTDWLYIRKLINEVSEKTIYKIIRKRPMVLPVVIEV